MQQFVHQDRPQTLDDLQRQRIATPAAERLAATTDLRRERQTMLDALRGQEVVSDMSATSEKEIQTVDAKGRDLIDHLFLRALELMRLVLVLFSLVAWFLLRRFSARPRQQSERLFHRAA